MDFCDKNKIRKGKVRKGCIEVISGCNKGVTPDYIWPCRVGPKGRRGRSVPGHKGATGEPGEQGPPGPPGIQGAQGAQGNPGGSIGEQGDPGQNGHQGAQGNPGHDGSQGAQGDPGKDGSQGAQGNPGKDGSQGAQGNPGKDGSQGAQGNPGKDGSNGMQGNPGMSPAGEKGISGAQGTVGPVGNPGNPAPNNPSQIYGQAPATFSSSVQYPTFTPVPLSSPITFSSSTTTEAILYINLAGTAVRSSPVFAGTSYYLKIDGGVNGSMFNRTINIPAIPVSVSPATPTYSLRCSQAIYTKILPLNTSITITLSIANSTDNNYVFTLGNSGFITATVVSYL